MISTRKYKGVLVLLDYYMIKSDEADFLFDEWVKICLKMVYLKR